MRCLIVQNRLGADGRTRCVAELVRLLNDAGVEPLISCLGYGDPDIGRAFSLGGLRYRLLPAPRVQAGFGAFTPEIFLSNLLAGRVVRLCRPDLVVNSNCVWRFLPAGPRYLHYVHFSLRAVAREFPRYGTGIGRAYGALLRAIDTPRLPPRSTLVANSELVREQLRTDYGFDAAVAYPPAWSGELAPCRPEARRVVTLGAFRRDKRQLEQIEIARRLPDWSFTLLGARESSRYADALERAARRTPNVSLVPNPTRRRVREELARASHFVHTHRAEGFGIAVVEAAAAGCVPVVPDRGGVREIVEPEALRFETTSDCVDALRRTAGEAGCRLLGQVQRGLERFSDAAFRSSLRAVLLESRAFAP